MAAVTSNAIAVEQWRDGDKEYCAVVTHDVKNAFNSADWQNNCEALKRMQVPKYMLDVITSYLSNRKLVYDSDNGKESYKLTAAVT